MGTCQPGSPFDMPLGAEIVTKAQQAVDMGQTSDNQVTLFTSGIPAQAVVANLIFHQAGFRADRMAQGELTEAEGEHLLKAVQTLATSRLLLIEDKSAWKRVQRSNPQTAKSIVLSWDV